MSNGFPKPERPDAMARRQEEERKELAADPVALDAENAGFLEKGLADKHEDEIRTGYPFLDGLEHQRYAEHKLDDSELFLPDPKGVYQRGEVASEEGHVFMGINSEGEAVLRKLRADGGTVDEARLPLSELHDDGDPQSEPAEAPAEVIAVALPSSELPIPPETRERDLSLTELRQELRLRIDDEQLARNVLENRKTTDARRANANAYLSSNARRFEAIARDLGAPSARPEDLLAFIEAKESGTLVVTPTPPETDDPERVSGESNKDRYLRDNLRMISEGLGSTIPDQFLYRVRQDPGIRAYAIADALEKVRNGNEAELGLLREWRWNIAKENPEVAEYLRKKLLGEEETERNPHPTAIEHLKDQEFPFVEGHDGPASKQMIDLLKRDMRAVGMSEEEIAEAFERRKRRARDPHLSPADIVAIRTGVLGKRLSEDAANEARAASERKPVVASLPSYEDFEREDLHAEDVTKTPDSAPLAENIIVRIAESETVPERLDTANLRFSDAMRALETEAEKLARSLSLSPSEKRRLEEIETEMARLEAAYLGANEAEPKSPDALPANEADLPVADQEIYIDPIMAYWETLDSPVIKRLEAEGKLDFTLENEEALEIAVPIEPDPAIEDPAVSFAEAMEYLIENTPEVPFSTPIAPPVPPVVTHPSPSESIPDDLASPEFTETAGAFDPERELKRILAADSKDRPQILKAYKEKLAWQKKGLAEVNAEMTRALISDPTMTQERFLALYGEKADAFAATKDQKMRAWAVYEAFRQRNEVVERYSSEYASDPGSLFEKAFGARPSGKVELVKEATAIYLKLHDPKDYALASGKGRHIDGYVVTEEDIKKANMHGGTYLPGSRIAELAGALIVENTSISTGPVVRDHELQHSLNALFPENVKADEYKVKRDSRETLVGLAALRDAFGEVRSIEQERAYQAMKKEVLLTMDRMMRYRLEVGPEKLAKDEIIAYLSDGSTPESVYETLLRKERDGGIYDYLANWGTETQIREELGGAPELEALREELVPEFVRVRDRIVESYPKTIGSALDAWKKLRDEGVAEDAIRAAFLLEPLSKWEKVAERLIDEHREVPEAIARGFESQFAVDLETLEEIPGFRTLSEGQQRLVLERLKSVALENVEKEKLVRYRAKLDSLAERSDRIGRSGENENYIATYKFATWLKKVGLRVMKQYNLGKIGDEAMSEWKEGGDPSSERMKKDTIAALVRSVKAEDAFGVDESGKNVVYVDRSDFKLIDASGEKKLEELNALANRYASTSFGENDAERVELKRRYDSLARDVSRMLAKDGGMRWGGDKAALWRTKLEGSITMARYYGDNSEVAEEFDRSGRNLGAAIGMRNMLVERGLYATASAGLRVAGVAGIGLAALPVVSAIGGAVMSWRRGREEFAENDTLATAGVEDRSDAMRHERGEGNGRDRARNVVRGEVLSRKLEAMLAEYQAASPMKRRDVVPRDRSGHARPSRKGRKVRLTEKEIARESLEARIDYTLRKLEERSVDLGQDPADRVEAMTRLSLLIGRAETEVGFTRARANATSARLETILDIREEKIESNRNKELIKKGLVGGAIGAAFSVAGIVAANLARGDSAFAGFKTNEVPVTPERLPGARGYSSSDIERVRAGIMARTDPRLPAFFMENQNRADARAFAEYMTATDPVVRHRIATTIGLTERDMNARISELMRGGGAQGAASAAAGEVRPLAPAQAASANVSRPETAASAASAPRIPNEVIETMEPSRASAFARRYVEEDMSSRTLGAAGQPRPEWAYLRGRSAERVLTETREAALERRGGADEWTAISRMQDYARATGLIGRQGIAPRADETLEEYFVRAHAARLATTGESARMSLPGSDAVAIPTEVARNETPSAAPVEVVPPLPPRTPTAPLPRPETTPPPVRYEPAPYRPFGAPAEAPVVPRPPAPPPVEAAIPRAPESAPIRYEPAPYRPFTMP